MEMLDKNHDGEVNFREFCRCVSDLAKCYYHKKTGKGGKRSKGKEQEDRQEDWERLTTNLKCFIWACDMWPCDAGIMLFVYCEAASCVQRKCMYLLVLSHFNLLFKYIYIRSE